MNDKPDYAALLLNDYAKMCHLRWMGETQMVSMMMAALNGVCIEVYVKKLDDGRYVISDGGYLLDETDHYNQETGIETNHQLVEHYNVKCIHNENNGKNLTYLTANKLELVTGCMFDLAHYMLATINWRILKSNQQCPTGSLAQ